MIVSLLPTVYILFPALVEKQLPCAPPAHCRAKVNISDCFLKVYQKVSD